VTDSSGRVFHDLYYCSTYVNESMYWNVNPGDSTYLDDSGFMYAASSVWVICQYQGRWNPTIQYNTNYWWVYTWGDESRPNVGGYGNGWGFLPATAVVQGGQNAPIPGVPDCTQVAPGVIPPVSSTLPFQAPRGGYLAQLNGSTSDPVNLVVYGDGLNASTAVKKSLERENWSAEGCYNPNVQLYTDQAWKSPNIVYTNDYGLSGCGTPGAADRDHVRLWTTAAADGMYVYGAASMEYLCGTNVHCVADNGYEQGKQTLYQALTAGLDARGSIYTTSVVYPAPYSPGILNGQSYGNNVLIIRITYDLGY
jgi:hypothetical protein